jgi:hypothetical protein
VFGPACFGLDQPFVPVESNTRDWRVQA